jgi:ABC-type branched-subunit amino acid transport system substrate-binding protein
MKIALVAPFEGRLRQVGYDAFPAMRIAIRDQINAGGTGNIYVTFIAYNDNGDPAMAERVARNVALDPEVLAVMGHFNLTTTLAAMGVYTSAGLPLLAPHAPADQLPYDPLVFHMGPAAASPKSQVTSQTCDPSPQFSILYSPFGECQSDAPPMSELPEAQQALASFTEISLGAAPTPRSIVAYDATNVLLEAIRLDAQAHGMPTRAGVTEALRHVSYEGLLGRIAFDDHGVWADAPLWVYPK